MALEKMSIPKEVKDVISAPLRSELIKQREGGGKKMLSYLSGSTITDMLNNAFGYTWSWRVDKYWIEDSQPYFNTYSKMPADQLTTNPANGKKGYWEEQGKVAHVLGTLTVWLKNGPQLVPIEKAGFGSKSVLGKQNDQESVFKSAGTDALKKAASLLGIGLELYRDEEEQAYFYEMNYEDPWTEEALGKYSEEREYIKNYISEYQVTDEDFANFVLEVTGNSYDVTPDNIVNMVDYIKKALAAASEE